MDGAGAGAAAARELDIRRSQRRSPEVRRALLALARGDLEDLSLEVDGLPAAKRWAAAKLYHVSR